MKQRKYKTTRDKLIEVKHNYWGNYQAHNQARFWLYIRVPEKVHYKMPTRHHTKQSWLWTLLYKYSERLVTKPSPNEVSIALSWSACLGTSGSVFLWTLTTNVRLVKCRPYRSCLHHCRPHSPFPRRTRTSWGDTGSCLYTGGRSHSLPLNTAVHPSGPDTGARRHTPAPGRCTSSRGRTETGLLEQNSQPQFIKLYASL